MEAFTLTWLAVAIPLPIVVESSARLELTQAELAERAGVTRKSIHAIETGNMVPSTILALKLAKVLGVTVEELFAIEILPA